MCYLARLHMYVLFQCVNRHKKHLAVTDKQSLKILSVCKVIQLQLDLNFPEEQMIEL